MSKPSRIQLSRARGWRKPEGAVVVSRPSVFGNPFKPRLVDAEVCVRNYREWLSDAGGRFGMPDRRAKLLARLPELRGKDLACWCKAGAACHADVLLELANA